ncbi:hypothetical protein WJX77_001568 [Trebouxia sp. C0004]
MLPPCPALHSFPQIINISFPSVLSCSSASRYLRPNASDLVQAFAKDVGVVEDLSLRRDLVGVLSSMGQTVGKRRPTRARH